MWFSWYLHPPYIFLPWRMSLGRLYIFCLILGGYSETKKSNILPEYTQILFFHCFCVVFGKFKNFLFSKQKSLISRIWLTWNSFPLATKKKDLFKLYIFWTSDFYFFFKMQMMIFMASLCLFHISIILKSKGQFLKEQKKNLGISKNFFLYMIPC